MFLQARLNDRGVYVSEASQIFDKAKDCPVVFIDNAHLLGVDTVEVLTLLKMNKKVYVSGEALNPYGMAYPQIGGLLCHADEIIKREAVCTKCPSDARYTYYMKKEKTVICEPRCFSHWKRSLG